MTIPVSFTFTGTEPRTETHATATSGDTKIDCGVLTDGEVEILDELARRVVGRLILSGEYQVSA